MKNWFYICSESVILALRSLWRNKLRSFLTILGISIGILTIITLITLIVDLNLYVANQLASMGSNSYFVGLFPMRDISRSEWLEIRKRPELEIEDAEALQEKCKTIKHLAYRDMKQRKIRYKNEETNYVFVIGSNEELQFSSDMEVEYGRFITKDDELHARQVVVLGQDVVDSLFPYEDPIGKRIKIGGYPFKVIGTIAEMGSFMGISRDNSVIIPITTYDKYFNISRRMMYIIIPKDEYSQLASIEEVRYIMRQRRGLSPEDEDNFEITTQEGMMELFSQLTNVIFIVMISVGSISLVVGGVGIMNVMLVSVKKRTREIGIRKAIGATRKHITIQFILEAIILSLIGGVIGIGISALLSRAIANMATLPTAFPIWVVLLGFGFSTLIGMIFGIYPANKAAKLDPIKALSYE
jgi:putative ABC transport system permease protein